MDNCQACCWYAILTNTDTQNCGALVGCAGTDLTVCFLIQIKNIRQRRLDVTLSTPKPNGKCCKLFPNKINNINF